jgi:hypothetical protein
VTPLPSSDQRSANNARILLVRCFDYFDLSLCSSRRLACGFARVFQFFTFSALPPETPIACVAFWRHVRSE